MEDILICCIRRVKAHNIGNRQTILISPNKFYRVASAYFALNKNGKIESGSTASQELFYDGRITETNSKFETRHPRLGYGKLRRSNAKAVANMSSFVQTLSREILSESAPG